MVQFWGDQNEMLFEEIKKLKQQLQRGGQVPSSAPSSWEQVEGFEKDAEQPGTQGRETTAHGLGIRQGEAPQLLGGEALRQERQPMASGAHPMALKFLLVLHHRICQSFLRHRSRKAPWRIQVCFKVMISWSSVVGSATRNGFRRACEKGKPLSLMMVEILPLGWSVNWLSSKSRWLARRIFGGMENGIVFRMALVRIYFRVMTYGG